MRQVHALRERGDLHISYRDGLSILGAADAAAGLGGGSLQLAYAVARRQAIVATAWMGVHVIFVLANPVLVYMLIRCVHLKAALLCCEHARFTWKRFF